MPVSLVKTPANEQSTYRVTVNILSSDPKTLAATVDSLTWSLRDSATGAIINGRVGVTVTSPANPYPLILTGPDLAVTEETATVDRVLLVEAFFIESGQTYPFREEYLIRVNNLQFVEGTGQTEDLDFNAADTPFNASDTDFSHYK